MRGRGRPAKGEVVLKDRTEIYQIWNKALDSSHGIVIQSSHPKLLAAWLYEARREAIDKRWHPFAVITVEGEVWIVRRREE